MQQDHVQIFLPGDKLFHGEIGDANRFIELVHFLFYQEKLFGFVGVLLRSLIQFAHFLCQQTGIFFQFAHLDSCLVIIDNDIKLNAVNFQAHRVWRFRMDSFNLSSSMSEYPAMILPISSFMEP